MKTKETTFLLISFTNLMVQQCACARVQASACACIFIQAGVCYLHAGQHKPIRSAV